MSKYVTRAGASAAWLAGFAQLLLCSGSAVAQTFVAQGPGPGFGLVNTIGSADQSPNGTTAGAIQAILPDPALGAETLFAGSPNGGIWISNNFGTTWTALTDHQASLSIASLGLDPTDSTGKTIIAGVGITDNGEYSQFNIGSYQGRGGAQTGLLYTADAGATWRALSLPAANANESVVGVAARGNTLLAATYEVQNATGPTSTYGLFRSTDDGTTFTKISGAGTGLPNGAVTSLVADPSNSSRFYAAVQQSLFPGQTAVYVSNDTGATWTKVFSNANTGLISGATTTSITLAAGPNGSVAIAISNLDATPFLAGVFLSSNQGATWNQITAAPNVVPGGQAPVNLHIAIDPHNANILYLTGDAYQTCTQGTSLCSVQAFRLNYDPSNNSSTATSLTTQGTPSLNFLDASTVHADSRAIAFDASGNLILTSDGGIYLRNNPQGNGTWQGLNGNLAAFEGYVVAYDANSKRVGIAAQDNGVLFQSAPSSPLFNTIASGDGTNVAINDKTLSGLSAIYSTSEDLGGLSRMIVNAQGQVVSPYDPVNNAAGTFITCNGGHDCTFQVLAGNTFSALFVLNRIDPTLIAMSGKNGVYTTQDTLSGANGINSNAIDLTLTNIGTTGGAPSVITYGTLDNTQAMAVGSPSSTTGQVWFSAGGALTHLTNYHADAPTGMVFDNRSENRLFVADATNLFYTTNAAGGAATFSTLTANLPAGFVRPTSVEFISNNGVNALLIGGLNTPLMCTSAPNGCVISSSQSPITVVDSDAGGNLFGWRAFGTGLPNALVYQMAYNPAVDVLAASSIGRSAWVMYDVTSNFSQATVLQFGLADNDSHPDAALLTDGTVGSRPLIKYGTGTLTITGDATYSGSTTVNGGTLDVDGTISNTSSVLVNSTGTLTGTGTVDPVTVTIASGGMFAPGAAGAPGTSMTIGGNLAFQNGAYYAIQINGASSTFATVTGTASLGGTVLASFTPGIIPLRQYTILTSAGLNGTAFSALVTSNQPQSFDASLAYTADNAFIDMTAALGAGTALNGNQQNAANVINAFFNNGGTLTSGFSSLFSLSGGSLATALSQLDGEDATGAEKSSFQLMSDFLNLMLDPTAGGGIGGGGNALGFQPEQDPALPPEIALAYNKMLTKAPLQHSFGQRWSVWGSAFGAAAHFDGNAAVGSNSVSAQDFGFAGGMDYRVSPDTAVGFGLAGGGTNWSVDQNLGSGRSDAFESGVYTKTHAGPAYLAAALAFGNHWFSTARTAALGDALQAKFDGQSYGGRLEAGYRYGLPLTRYVAGITPYAALQAQALHTPAYSETDLTGGGFGLAYNAMTATDTRSELGVRADNLAMLGRMPLVLRGRLAWAHDWVSNPAFGAAFAALPGANFVVIGAALPKNSALTTAAAELHMTANWSLTAKFDGQFGSGAQAYAGTGTLRYSW